jgi:hypothetical protein
MTEEKATTEYMAALGAVIGSLIYQEPIKKASLLKDTKQTKKLMEDYGKMILETAGVKEY